MSERITDAELNEHVEDCEAARGERWSEWMSESDIDEVARRIVAEVRRLKGIILAEHEMVIASRVAPITAAFQAEAVAIRAEQQPITVLTQEWSIPLNLPERDRLLQECMVVDAPGFDRTALPDFVRQLESQRDEARTAKDAAYTERNRLVAALAHIGLAVGWRVGLRKTDIEGWDPEWHNCVWFSTGAGQLSWHFHDSDAPLFADIPAWDGPAWDGHTTPEKYQRLAEAARDFAI
jgi:hypothetical protein